MITKVEIDGFKSFRGFSIELSPFVVIAGLNAVGKSNLFDALLLLSRIANSSLREAFGHEELRGEAAELFRINASGTRELEMNFAVELLLNASVTDNWHSTELIKYRRVRYELTIRREKDNLGIERLFVLKEALIPIKRSSDEWYARYILKSNFHFQAPTGRKPFIDTPEPEKIYLHQDGGSSGKPIPVDKLGSTVLSSISTNDFPHAYAVKKEMSSWLFLKLNPEAMRKPSNFLTSNDFIGIDGSSLASMLFRLKQESPNIVKHLSREISRFVADIKSIDVVKDEIEKKYILQVRTLDDNIFSSSVLSEGTLRLVALCLLKFDRKNHSVVCFEEPENGIHPSRIQDVFHLLFRSSTDFSESNSNSLSQILVNTHSPRLIKTIEEFSSKPNSNSWLITLYFADLSKIVNKAGVEKSTKFIRSNISTLNTIHFKETIEENSNFGSHTLRAYLENN